MTVGVDRVPAVLTQGPSLLDDGRPVPGQGQHLLAGRGEPQAHGLFGQDRPRIVLVFEGSMTDTEVCVNGKGDTNITILSLVIKLSLPLLGGILTRHRILYPFKNAMGLLLF